MHFGIIGPPVAGHIHPFGALGRELIARGHRVTLFQMADVEERARAEGVDFAALGQSDHPPGSLPESLAKLGRLDGIAALRFTVQAVRKTTEMICRDAPDVVRGTGVDMLLVDQTEPAGGTVAERLSLPFVTICNALAINREPSVPPPFTPWPYGQGLFAQVRNAVGYAISARIMAPVTNVLRTYRERWQLPAHRTADDSFSRLAQISQQPPAFDFPRRTLPPTFHYAGPLRTPSGRNVPFPWDQLDGRPLIYASLGTLQNGKERVFRCFAEACQGLDAQLAITHGGGLDESTVASLPGKPLVVSYAPQLEVLARASLTLTHAGLNTVLDSLSCGVPVVAVPITYEQPAIAMRVRWTGVGQVVPFARLNVQLLRKAVRNVLGDRSFAVQAHKVAESIRFAGGAGRAADIIEGLKV
jgi:MGT family glycosyltransferase